MCWSRQSECAVTRSTTAFVSATDVKMVGKHASACGYGDDRTSSLCSYVIFLEGVHVESIVFAPLVSTHYWCCIPSPTWCRCSPFFVQALAGSHGLKYDFFLLPTTGRKFDFALFTSRATCAGEPKLAPQAVCVWIREEHVRSVENRGAQHVVQLCTRQLGCMQSSTAHSTLTNMSLPSASSLESP